MRVGLLKKQFGKDIQKTFLAELSESKLTILIHSTNTFDDDLESNLLLPTNQIVKNTHLQMDELFAVTKEDGRLNDSSLGFSVLSTSKDEI